MLEVKNISKVFAKGTVNEHVAIKNMSLSLDDGEFVTVVGSNGAGKSTLFNAICGSFLVDSGHIFLVMKKLHIKVSMPGQKIGSCFSGPHERNGT